jgi:hypothetical protein
MQEHDDAAKYADFLDLDKSQIILMTHSVIEFYYVLSMR